MIHTQPITYFIYFSEQEKTYYSDDKINECEICQSKIEEIGFIKVIQSKKQLLKLMLCKECVKGIKSLNIPHDRTALYQFYNVSKIPKDAFPILDFSIDLKPMLNPDGSEISVFDVDKIHSDVTIDKTNHSKYVSWESVKIGTDIKPELENKPVSDDDINKIFSAVAYDDKDKLGWKNEKEQD